MWHPVGYSLFSHGQMGVFSLSSGDVTIKIMVVIQPYTCYNFFYEMLQINLIRGTWTACGKSDGARAPGPEVLQVTTSDADVSESPRKTTTIYTRTKTKTISKNPRRDWEKNEYMNALECLLRADKKGVKKRDWENSAWFVDREGNVGNWWKNFNEPNKNDQVQR